MLSIPRSSNRSFETPETTEPATQRHITEDVEPNQKRSENLKFRSLNYSAK
jgi:hypothetical protein